MTEAYDDLKREHDLTPKTPQKPDNSYEENLAVEAAHAFYKGHIYSEIWDSRTPEEKQRWRNVVTAILKDMSNWGK